MNPVRYGRGADLWKWQPLDTDLAVLKDEINRLFESPLARARYSEFFETWSPPMDLLEDKESLRVNVELPGMKREDIEVSLVGDSLTISGEKKQAAQEGHASRSERLFGRFQRSLKLPKPVDAGKIKAVYKDGILTISMAKAEEAKPRKIEVKASK